MYAIKLHTHDPHARLLKLLTANRYMVGAKIIRFLISQPGRPMTVQELCRRIHKPDIAREKYAKVWSVAFPPIPAIDEQARTEYKQRLKRLRERQAGGDADPEIDWEIGWLVSELKRAVCPGGSLRGRHPERALAYHAFYTSLWKLFAKIREEDEEVFFYLRANLQTGHSFCWNKGLESSGCAKLQAPPPGEQAA